MNQHHMTPHERDEGFDYEGQREYNCRFGDPVVDSDREQDNKDFAGPRNEVRQEDSL